MSFITSIVNRFKDFIQSLMQRRPRTVRYGTVVSPTGKYISGGSRGKDKDLPPEDLKVSASEAVRFVYHGEELLVNSSNVAWMRYTISTNILVIGYLNGAEWEYGNISEQEAIYFSQIHSKGEAVWSVIRVRGKGNSRKHRKPAHRIK